MLSALSENVKKKLVNALDDKNAAMFVADGKLLSIEVHDVTPTNEESDNLAREIELYPELKESLQCFLDK